MKIIFLSIGLLVSSFLSCQNTILWKISSTRNNNISYLLGTNHLFGKTFVDSLPVIKEKIRSADMVITETKMDREKIATAYNDRPSSDSFNIVLSKEDADYISAILARTNVQLSKFTPGELFIKLQAGIPKYKCPAVNTADKITMDEYIQNIGAEYKKQSYNLETDSFQFEKIAMAASKYNWMFFKRNAPILVKLYKDPKPNEAMCMLINQYASFAIDYKFNEECNYLKANSPLSNDEFIKKRNADWMTKLPALLEKNNCFIAVGLGHLYNQCGIVKQLEKLGYKVEPVSMR